MREYGLPGQLDPPVQRTLQSVIFYMSECTSVRWWTLTSQGSLLGGRAPNFRTETVTEYFEGSRYTAASAQYTPAMN